MKLPIAVLLTVTSLATHAAEESYGAADVLRAQCAKSYVEYSGRYAGAEAYSKAYVKDSKGYYRFGDKAYVPCSEAQYAAYLDKADPAMVMAAYPTAAGRPGYKKDAKPIAAAKPTEPR